MVLVDEQDALAQRGGFGGGAAPRATAAHDQDVDAAMLHVEAGGPGSVRVDAAQPGVAAPWEPCQIQLLEEG